MKSTLETQRPREGLASAITDLPDEEDNKSPVLLLGVNKITNSPFSKRRPVEAATTSGSIKFFRPPKSKYLRNLHGDERLEKIRQDLFVHKQPESTRPRLYPNLDKDKDCDIEFRYKDLQDDTQPKSSRSSYDITNQPKIVERRLLANLNDRVRKTLSLDSRKIDTNCVVSVRPVSFIEEKLRPKKKRNSFFSFEFFDRKSDSSDDFSSSKYKSFDLEDSPLLSHEVRTPDLLNLPAIQSDAKRQLEKLENHFFNKLNVCAVIDAEPKDAKNRTHEDEVEYIEPIKSNFTSQSTLVLEVKDNNAEIDISAFEIEVREEDLQTPKVLKVKVMDKSIDSIGSCSLDVDASTDFSDTTSGSLNLLTPSSTNSCIRDFTSRFHERAISLQPPTPVITPIRTPDYTKQDHLKPPPKLVLNDTLSIRSRAKKKEKKPSYLNLACSVNGYTNLTTYDSKLRQDISKSREASPNRPLTHLVPVPVSADKLLVPAFQTYDPNNLTVKAPTKALTDPQIAAPYAFMAEENKQLKKDFFGDMASTYESKFGLKDEIDNAKEIFKSSFSENNFVSNGSKVERYESYTITNGVKRLEISKENVEILSSPMKSFIQQRVERLYGPGALAQGFFNQKRYKMKSVSEDDFPKHRTSLDASTDVDDLNCSLPVMRHLRPEFRAQLPISSPKKSPTPSPQKNIPIKTEVKEKTNGVAIVDEMRGKEMANGCKDVVKDGHYFLDLEKKETERLIALAVTADKELEDLQGQEVDEEILGFLRSASGKARLLATQKMQQFEGLCYNNINKRADEQFPTTNEDLQGFWDMVCLQVDNVNGLYEQMALLKANGWKEIKSPEKKSAAPTSTPRVSTRNRTSTPANNEKARLAAQKRDADRKALMEHRRRAAREMQASLSPNNTDVFDTSDKSTKEVEIFVGKTSAKTNLLAGSENGEKLHQKS